MGVTQGSQLGPLLCFLFIDCIVSVIAVEHLLFAYDIKVICQAHSRQSQECLQQSPCSIISLGSANSMELTVYKRQVMAFKRRPIDHVYGYKIKGAN